MRNIFITICLMLDFYFMCNRQVKQVVKEVGAVESENVKAWKKRNSRWRKNR